MSDEALASINLRNASSVDIETNHTKSGFHRCHGKRNTDVAKTDDADAGGHVFEGSQQIQSFRIERAGFYGIHCTPLLFLTLMRSELRHLSALCTRLLSAIQRPDIMAVSPQRLLLF